jgi:hypothetical protein
MFDLRFKIYGFKNPTGCRFDFYALNFKERKVSPPAAERRWKPSGEAGP